MINFSSQNKCEEETNFLMKVKPLVYYKVCDNFTSQLCLLATKIYRSASLSASLPLKSLLSQDDEWISELDKSCRQPFLGRFFVNSGHISYRFLMFLLLILNR